MLKGLFDLGRSPRPVTAHVPAWPAGAAQPPEAGCLKWTPVLGPDVKVWRVLLFPNGWSGK